MQQIEGPKALFLHNSRYCDSRVSFKKLGFFLVFPLTVLLRKMVSGICRKVRSLGFAYFLTEKMKLSSLELGLIGLFVGLFAPAHRLRTLR